MIAPPHLPAARRLAAGPSRQDEDGSPPVSSETGADAEARLTVRSDGEDRCRWSPVSDRRTRMFGGQLIAQSLSAAMQTVPPGRYAHSLHATFLAPARTTSDITFDIARLRDGRSFSVRHVTANQNSAAVFVATVSCHDSETGLGHRLAMPGVPPPEALVCEYDRWAAAMSDTRVRWLRSQPSHPWVDLRAVTPIDLLNVTTRPPVQHFWVRTTTGLPQDGRFAQLLLAYMSDLMMLGTILLPHGVHWSSRQMDTASLDHAIWFHAGYEVDEWLLMSLDTPWTGSSRGLARATFRTRDGRIVASAAQEGLMRMR